MTTRATIAALMLVAMAVLTTGCELRRDDQPADDGPGEADTLVEAALDPKSEPDPAVPQGASIIRDEDAAPEPVLAPPPPRPLRLVIPFPDGGTGLSERSERLLAGALEARAMEAGWPVILRGHTDSAGNDRANLRASRARAEAVAAWLVEHGLADERIEVIAMGEQNPIAPNALPDGSPNEQGRESNRRVELVVAPPPAAPPAARPAAAPGSGADPQTPPRSATPRGEAGAGA